MRVAIVRGKTQIYKSCSKRIIAEEPTAQEYSRIIEHKWFTFGRDAEGKELPKTVISREYSAEWQKGDEPYYPVNDEPNAQLYKQYKQLADKEQKTIFGGRLGEYQYYDMDVVIEKAMALAKRIV